MLLLQPARVDCIVHQCEPIDEFDRTLTGHFAHLIMYKYTQLTVAHALRTRHAAHTISTKSDTTFCYFWQIAHRIHIIIFNYYYSQLFRTTGFLKRYVQRNLPTSDITLSAIPTEDRLNPSDLTNNLSSVQCLPFRSKFERSHISLLSFYNPIQKNTHPIFGAHDLTYFPIICSQLS